MQDISLENPTRLGSAGGECEVGAGARGLHRAAVRDFQVIRFPGFLGVTTV